jgi:hypothetical protein
MRTKEDRLIDLLEAPQIRQYAKLQRRNLGWERSKRVDLLSFNLDHSWGISLFAQVLGGRSNAWVFSRQSLHVRLQRLSHENERLALRREASRQHPPESLP